MVENSEFLNRLRNGHLEKSAVTGLFHPSRSPTTAKMPLKVHFRLRFQNLGKPRTAGLCGRAAGACDCGPLSCTKIERPSLLEKPSCKVRLFVQNRSRKYRQKVTVTTLFQTAFHRIFQLLPQTAHICFHRRKWVHTRPSEKNRTQRLTRRNRGLPSLDHSAALRCLRNHSNQLHLQPLIPPCFYIHTFPGSLWPPTISNSSISDHLSSRFSTSRTNGPRLLSQAKAGTHSAFGERSHTRAHTAKQGGVSDGGGITTLGAFHTFRKPCVAGYQNGKLCRFWALVGGALEEHRKPSEQRCAYACRCPEGVAAPLGCVIFFHFCRNCDLYAIRACAR